MTPHWQAPGRSLTRRSWQETWASIHALPLWRRLDAIFVLLVALLLAGLVLFCSVAVEAADRAGWLNSWTLRPLADERILTNVRDRIADSPLLAAAFHGPESALYVAQAGGTVHRFDPRTGLWQSEDPLEGRLLNRDFIELRSGCGTDPESRYVAQCPDPASLWAVNGERGLVRRTDEGWSVVVGDSSLVGQTGEPLESDALTTAAVSTDGRWLAVGTKQDGVGLYDVQEHRWLPAAEASRQLPGLRVSHLAWWRDRFWVGGSSGLASMAPGQGIRVEAVAGVTGEVIDLDADADGSLYVLTRTGCENNITGCQRFVALDAPETAPRELVAESRLYPELNLVGLSFAQYAGNQFAVAGQRGVYVYDAGRHAWSQVFDQPVLSTLPLADGSGFYYGFAGGAGLYQGQDQPRWDTGGERIVRLHPGAAGEAIALTESGNAYSLPRNADARLLYVGSGTRLDPEKLRAGFAVGTTVVLFGPDGAILHDVSRRRFEDVPAANLPPWLQAPELRFVSAADRLYALLPGDGSTQVYTLDGSRLIDGSYYSGDLRQAQPQTVPTGLPASEPRTWVWADQGLGLLGADGSVYRVAGPLVDRVTGPVAPALAQMRVLDVADEDGGLAVATDSGIRRYNANRRDWSDPFRIAGKDVVELARLAGRLVGRTTDSQLVQEGIRTVTPTVLIGESGFTITDAGLSDARITDSALFLAGQGRVERYDLAGRRVGERWSLVGDEPVQIRALLDGRPLSLTAGRAFIGDRPLDTDAAGAVRSLSTTASQIVTVRERDKNRYLKLYDIANQAAARCFFRTQTAEGATRVTDARAFSDGTVAVATDAGLRFYSPAMRSWLRGPADLLPRGGRLYVVGGSVLVLVDEQQAEHQLTIAPISAMRLPESCSDDPVSVQGETFPVRAVAVEEATGRVAWLTAQGAMMQWENGQSREILAAQGEAPAPGDLRRLYARPVGAAGAAGALLLTTDRPDRPLWRYDLAARRWTPITLAFAGPVQQIQDVNLEPSGDTETVLVRVDNGDAYLGTLRPGDASVTMTRIFMAGTPGFGAAGSEILDVQDWDANNSRWSFLLQDRLRYYDPSARTWFGDVPLPIADPSLTMGRAQDRMVLTAENGRAWFVATTPGPTPTRFARAELQPGEPTAIDASGTIWRRLPTGEVSRCDLSGDQYACRTAIPAPPALDPNVVQQAYSWRGEVLFFVLADGVRGYDPRTAQWVDLPPEVATLRGPLTMRTQGTRLLIHAGDTLVTLTGDQARGFQATVLTGVRELVGDDTTQSWVRLDDGWRVWNGQEFVAPAFAPGTGGSERVLVTEGSLPLAVGANGALSSWRGRMEPDQGRLPSSILPGEVRALARVAPSEWWVVTTDRVDRLARRDCRENSPPVCLEVAGSVALPADFGPTAGQAVVSVRIGSRDDLQLIDAAGNGLTIQHDGNGQLRAVNGAPAPPPPVGQLPDDWPNLRANLQQLPDGRWTYEPILRFELDGNGALMAARQSSRSRLAERGALQVVPVPPMNAQWLRWDRAAGGFVVRTPSGPLAIPKADVVVGDRLLFEAVDAIVAERTDAIHTANTRGILTYHNASLSLTDPAITFQPLGLTAPIEGAHGRFITPSGEVPVNGSQLQPHTGPVTVQVGDVALREESDRRVMGTLSISGTSTNALTDRGFLWDLDRRGLAYAGGRLLLQSAAGIHPADALTGFDAGPGGLGTGAGRLRTETGTGVILDGQSAGAGLWQLDQGTWTALPSDPALDRPLLDDAAWSWRMTGGQIAVTLRGDAQAFAASFGGDGFGFTSDQLLAGSAHAGRLYLMTAGLFEIADTPDQLKGIAGRRLAPSQTDSLEDVYFADGSAVLFQRAGPSVARLDDAAGQFQPVTGGMDPYTRLPLVTADRLRLTRTGGQVQKELRLDQPSAGNAGGSGWVGFNFVQVSPGSEWRFPFDVVTSVATVGNELFVGTAAGLAVSSGGAGLADLQALYALNDPSAPGLTSVTRIGQPASDPSLMMARSARACIERRAGGVFAVCRDASLLDTRLRVQTPFWQWTENASGQVTGQYREQSGALDPASIAPVNGRLPHDNLADAVVCGDRGYSLWQSGWLTEHQGNTLSLTPPGQSYAPGEVAPRLLLCLAGDVTAGSTVISAGLYAGTDDARYLRFSSNGWLVVTDPAQQQGLDDLRRRPMVFARDRLRLPQAQVGRGLVFEQRAADGRWLPLAWITDSGGERRLEIDRWSELIQQDGRLWVATPAGLALFDRDANGRAYLDPDRWALIREPLVGDRPCAISDLELADGALHARCNGDSAQVFTVPQASQLDGQRDTGLFVAASGPDPFAERVLVNAETAGRWVWRVTGRRGGQPGVLTGRWFSRGTDGDPGEEIQLVGGRFTFDRLTSVAVARPGTIEVGSGAGWIEAPRGRYQALDLRRPEIRNVDPTTFDAVSTTRSEGREYLCLRDASGGYLRLAADGARDNPQACPQFLADDDLWRYERTDAQQPQAALTIRARDGGAVRELRAGRFTDDQVAGLPVTGSEAGRPFYLLPTAAGVLRLNERLARTGIIGEGFTGLTNGNGPASPPGASTQLPSALFMLDPTTPAYVGADGLYRLGEPDAAREPLPLALPAGARLLAVEDGPFDFVRVRWAAGEMRGSSLISRDASGTGVVSRLALNASDFRPFTDRRGTTGAISPWLWIEMVPGQVLVTRQDTGASQTILLPAGWGLVEPVIVGGPGRHRLLLIGAHDLFEVNLDRVIEQLYPPPG